LQHVTVQAREPRYKFYSDFLSRLENELIAAKILSEKHIPLSGNVHRYNLRIWGSHNVHEVNEYGEIVRILKRFLLCKVMCSLFAERSV
jgi:hypothetical protein